MRAAQIEEHQSLLQVVSFSDLNQVEGGVPLGFHSFQQPLLSDPHYDHGALTREAASAHEEWSWEDAAQCQNFGPQQKTYPLWEAQTPRQEGRTRVQSWRLEWLEEVGQVEVGL